MDLDKYKKGDLTEAELDLFTGELVRAKFNQAQKDKWAKKLAAEYEVKREIPPKAKVIQFPYKKLAIAASILLLLALIPFLQNYIQPKSQQLANTYIENRLSLPDIKRGTTSVEIINLKTKAHKAYTNKNFKGASIAYEAFLNTEDSEGVDYLFAGLSYLYSGNSKEAVKKLTVAQTKITEGQSFWEETNWFLSLAYLKNEEIKKAQQQLKAIIKTDNFYSDKAQKILSTL